MATFTIPRLIRLTPIRLPVPTVTKPAPVVVPVKPVTVKPPGTLPVNIGTRTDPVYVPRGDEAIPVLKIAPPSPYLPSITPRAPVVYPFYPGPASPEPVRAPEPAPLTAHRFSTCQDCGKEQVTDIETPAAPTLTLAPPAPVATPAPTPTPATPTAEVKPKAGRGWVVAFAVLFLLVGGLALASAVRPRK